MLIMEMFAVVKNYYVLREKLLKKVGEIGTICTESSHWRNWLERETKIARSCHLLLPDKTAILYIRIVRTWKSNIGFILDFWEIYME